MSVSILVIGDLHITTGNVTETDTLINSILDIINKHKKIKHVFIMGDTLDRFENYNGHCLAAADTLFRQISAIRPITVLIGNHDIPHHRDYMSAIHPFVGHKGLENINIVDTSSRIIEIDDMKFLGVPYAPKGRFKDAIFTGVDDLEDITAIFAHQEIKGCSIAPGQDSTDGDYYSRKMPLLISGHIHAYQRPQSNVVYVGSPRQVNFGEKYADKTVSIFTFYAGDKWKEKRLSLRLKEKVVLRLNVEDVYDYTFPPDCHIKLIIVGTHSEIRTIDGSPKLKKLKKEGVIITYDYTYDDRVIDESIDMSTLEFVPYKSLLIKKFKKKKMYMELYQDVMKTRI